MTEPRYAKDDFYKEKPLIEVMTEKDSSFMIALRKFPQVAIYASALNDLTVVRSIALQLFIAI